MKNLLNSFDIGKFTRVVLASVVGVYFLQLFSPLRLNTDAYRLLAMGISAHDGNGYLVDGHPDQFPLGYPNLVRILYGMGIANSATLIGFNVLCTLLFLAFFWRIQGSSIPRSLEFVPLLLVLSCWVLIKHITIPLSDAAYCAMSAIALFCLQRFYVSRFSCGWRWFCLGILFIFLGIWFRTVGISMLPALVFTFFAHREIRQQIRQVFQSKYASGLAFFLACFVLVFFFQRSSSTQWYEQQFLRPGSYFQMLVISIEQNGVVACVAQNILFRLQEMVEIFLNFPSTKFSIPSGVYIVTGLIGWIFALSAFVWLFLHGFAPIGIYALGYTALLFLWPYYDPRFWIPLLPIFAWSLIGVFVAFYKKISALRFILPLWLFAYLALGALALVFSTRISFSGRMISEVFGDESTRMTYRQSFANGMPVEMEHVHPGKARLLNLLESRSTPSR